MNTKVLFIALLCSFLVVGGLAHRRHRDPLKKYVNNGDDSYEYTVLRTVRADAYTVSVSYPRIATKKKILSLILLLVHPFIK
jgi:hypothetical protein